MNRFSFGTSTLNLNYIDSSPASLHFMCFRGYFLGNTIAVSHNHIKISKLTAKEEHLDLK